MKNEVKVSFYLEKSEMKEAGKCPVIARLSVGKYSKIKFSMKMTVPAKLCASGRAIGNSQAAIKINQ